MKCAVNFFAVVFCIAVGGVPVHADPQDVRHGRAQENNLKDIGRIFEEADANHDGMLTREEAEKIPMLFNQFNDMDINQDGKVTRQEMVASMKMKKRHHRRNMESLYR